MKRVIDKLIEAIQTKHLPYPPTTQHAIEYHERRIGYKFPEDLRHFYLHCNGVELFVERHFGPFRLLPVKEVKRTSIYIFGEANADVAPKSWYAICDVMDGNYIGIDLEPKTKSIYPIIDCFHETHTVPEYDEIIAQSFTEFLQRLLKGKGETYWIAKGFKGYGPALPKLPKKHKK